jgi:glucose-6-phosphate isomerase
LIYPFGTDFDLIEGLMKAPDIRVERRASQMRGYYQNEEALEDIIRRGDDPLHYEVLEKDIPERYGQLRFSISKLQPGTVGEECFMTKGHYHSVAETAEIYLCLRGEGCMVMKTAKGLSRTEFMEPGRLVYVPPYWAHRSVNTGGQPLVSLCIYPAEAGHNYGDIEKEGFPQRVYRRKGKTEIVEG